MYDLFYYGAINIIVNNDPDLDPIRVGMKTMMRCRPVGSVMMRCSPADIPPEVLSFADE